MQRIDVISDAICPWCWVGKRHLDLALKALGQDRYEVHWRPFQLNPDMPEEGVDRSAYRAAKFGSVERGRELDAHVAAMGAAAGLDFRHDLMTWTPNTIRAHRLIRFAAGPRQHALVETLFRAYFAEGHNIGDTAVLASIAEAQGIGGAAELLAGDALDAEIRAEDAGFRRIGISGVPSFALDGQVLWSGAIGVAQMVETLRGSA